MAEILIIGDGPAGLSAALFLAKNGHQPTVFGTDQTPMHKAMLYNYLGIEEMTGSDFQRLARQQVQRHGAKIVDAEVTDLAKTGETFAATAGGDSYAAPYLIIASGPNPALAQSIGLELNEKKTVDTDRDGRTAVDRCYVVGWSSRPEKIQAIISAGDGAAAALDILSREAGKPFHDFDVVE